MPVRILGFNTCYILLSSEAYLMLIPTNSLIAFLIIRG